ncbi:unnamed protein product [Mortierella alpina]
MFTTLKHSNAQSGLRAIFFRFGGKAATTSNPKQVDITESKGLDIGECFPAIAEMRALSVDIYTMRRYDDVSHTTLYAKKVTAVLVSTPDTPHSKLTVGASLFSSVHRSRYTSKPAKFLVAL